MTTKSRLTRELETREVKKRPVSWVQENLPSPTTMDSAYRYGWKRVSLNGTYDHRNVASFFRKGYEACKLEEHPEYLNQTDPNSKFKDGIEIGGLLLCKIPKDLYNQRTEHFENQTQAQADAVDNNFMRQNDARMPLFAERKSGTSFGKGK
jgi:hypothetical protein